MIIDLSFNRYDIQQDENVLDKNRFLFLSNIIFEKEKDKQTNDNEIKRKEKLE